MHQSLLAGGLSIAGEVHADDAQRHAERKDSKSPDGHVVYRLRGVAVEQTRKRNGARNDDRAYDSHQRQIAAEHHAHNVGECLPILFADTDTDQHTGNGQHTGRDRPEEPHEIVRCSECRNTDAADKQLQQAVHDQTSYGLVHVAGGAGKPDAQNLSALFPVVGAHTEAQI